MTEDDEVLEWLIIQRSGADETVSKRYIHQSVSILICLYLYLTKYISIHYSICLFTNQSFCLYLHLSVYISICLLKMNLSVYLFNCLSVYLSICLFVYMSICLSVYLYIPVFVYLPVCLSIYRCICPIVYLLICLYVCLYVCLSTYPYKN